MGNPSSLFNLLRTEVRPGKMSYVLDKGATYYARYIFVDVGTKHSVQSWHDTLRVFGEVQLCNNSWLGPIEKVDGPKRIGAIHAEVEFSPSIMLDKDQPSFVDALWYACEQLNPMLDSYTTLFAINHNIDIEVEHRLRPVERMLRNLVIPQPRPHKGVLR